MNARVDPVTVRCYEHDVLCCQVCMLAEARDDLPVRGEDRALVDRAFKEDEDAEIDVFSATVPFGSNVHRRRD